MELIEYKEMREAIVRVRELINELKNCGKQDECWFYADKFETALDGEQSQTYECICLERYEPMGFHAHNCMRKNAGLPEYKGEQ